MMELPGSLAGSFNSPIPVRGPEASQRMSLATGMPVATSALPADHASTSAGIASIFSVGLEIGKIMGRSVDAAIASITSRVNVQCNVEVTHRHVAVATFMV